MGAPDGGTGVVSAETSTRPTKRQGIPTGVWVLGFVLMLMDVSSEMIHALERPVNALLKCKMQCQPTVSIRRSCCATGLRQPRLGWASIKSKSRLGH